jgi:hypothetical protein
MTPIEWIVILGILAGGVYVVKRKMDAGDEDGEGDEVTCPTHGELSAMVHKVDMNKTPSATADAEASKWKNRGCTEATSALIEAARRSRDRAARGDAPLKIERVERGERGESAPVNLPPDPLKQAFERCDVHARVLPKNWTVEDRKPGWGSGPSAWALAVIDAVKRNTAGEGLLETLDEALVSDQEAGGPVSPISNMRRCIDDLLDALKAKR